MAVDWTCKLFTELSLHELYAVLQLRSEVFVVEQNCPYLDCDNKDLKSYHLMGWHGDRLAAYARLLPAGISFPEPSIGRVVTSPSARKSGYGRELMLLAVSECYRLFGRSAIRIGAQLYLKAFYESIGFRTFGEVYLEDGIEHIEMILEKQL